VPVCDDCDYAKNEISLAYLRVPDRHELMAKYRAAVIDGDDT
jgi:hypothetical protein